MRRAAPRSAGHGSARHACARAIKAVPQSGRAGLKLRRRVFMLSWPLFTRSPPPPVTAVPLQPSLPPSLAVPRSPPPPPVAVVPSCVWAPGLRARAALHTGPLPGVVVGRKPLCKPSVPVLFHWAESGFGLLAFDLFCYFPNIFKSFQSSNICVGFI
jgi:hypothetical protein